MFQLYVFLFNLEHFFQHNYEIRRKSF